MKNNVLFLFECHLLESQKHQERWKNGPQMDQNFAIPLLMQNQAPEGFEDGDKVNVDLRPESVGSYLTQKMDERTGSPVLTKVEPLYCFQLVYPEINVASQHGIMLLCKLHIIKLLNT